MTDYGPGDIVTVEMEVTQPASWNGKLVLTAPGSSYILGPGSFADLIDSGKVTLVRRAEPDWQTGDVAQHVETGELFVYRPYAGRLVGAFDEPWLDLSAARGVHTPYRSQDELAGKLVRCTVTPEVTP